MKGFGMPLFFTLHGVLGLWLLFSVVPGGAAEAGASIEKTVFSISMHSFPYNRDYSDRIDFVDRPLDWDPGLTSEEAAQSKMQRMHEAGIDVCAQAVFYANGRPPVGGDTATGLKFLERSLHAGRAAGVKIAPEINMIHRSVQYGRADLADFFRQMIETFGEDPQWFRYQGKLVVFLWNPFDDLRGPAEDFGPAQLAEVWELLGTELRSRLYVVNETYYMVRRPDEDAVAHWNEDGYVDRVLSVTDNMFWWYSWPGATQEKLRAELLAATLREKTDEPIIAGIRPGYYRKNTGVINSHQGTAKFRELWDANLSVNPDWVYFYSMDDYGENGQIEPTRLNRGAYSALTRAMTTAWKNSAEELPAELWTGYPLTVMRGQELYAEVFRLNATSSCSQVVLALESADGQELFRSEPVSGCGEDGFIHVFPFSIPTTNEVFAGQRALVPVITTYEADEPQTYRGLSPIRLTRHHPMNPMYQFYRLDRLREPAALAFAYDSFDSESQSVTGTFSVETGCVPLHRAELRDLNQFAVPYDSALVHDIVCQSEGISTLHEGEPQWFEGYSKDRSAPFYLPLAHPTNRLEGDFSFSTRDVHDAAAMTYLFLEYADGTTWSSRPYWIERSNETVRTTTFDLSDPVRWRPVGQEALPAMEAAIGEWVFSDYDADTLCEESAFIPDRSLHGFPLYLGYGPNDRLYKDSPDRHPVFDQTEESFLFSGESQVLRLADFVFPPGAFTVEFELRPSPVNKDQWLLWHKRSAANVQLLADGRIELSRGEKGNQVTLQSRSALRAGEWNRIRVGDDGSRLFVYVDDRLDTFAPHEPLVLDHPGSTWSDLILVGGSTSDGFFNGEMRRLNILNSVPDLSSMPEEFLPAAFSEEIETPLGRPLNR
jgi:hypothetical protein